jgi:hypothetical protein
LRSGPPGAAPLDDLVNRRRSPPSLIARDVAPRGWSARSPHCGFLRIVPSPRPDHRRHRCGHEQDLGGCTGMVPNPASADSIVRPMHQQGWPSGG